MNGVEGLNRVGIVVLVVGAVLLQHASSLIGCLNWRDGIVNVLPVWMLYYVAFCRCINVASF